MTDRATLEALLARVLEGTGPDRELDAEIEAFLTGRVMHPRAPGWTFEPQDTEWKLARLADRTFISRACRPAPPFTGSLDAALTLVPEGKAWTVGQNVHHWYWSASVNALDEDGAPKSIGWGGLSNSPALALCAAALQARMEALGE
jgi:hypothetical protein